MTQQELLAQLDAQLDTLEHSVRALGLSKDAQRAITEQIYAIYTLAENDLEGTTETKRVRNLMTGQWVRIAKDTPRACDPSTELYWSM